MPPIVAITAFGLTKCAGIRSRICSLSFHSPSTAAAYYHIPPPTPTRLHLPPCLFPLVCLDVSTSLPPLVPSAITCQQTSPHPRFTRTYPNTFESNLYYILSAYHHLLPTYPTCIDLSSLASTCPRLHSLTPTYTHLFHLRPLSSTNPDLHPLTHAFPHVPHLHLLI